MNSKSILAVAALAVTIILGSFILGSAVAQVDLIKLGGFVVAVVAIGLFVILKKNVWILIPIFFSWGGNVGILPIPFSVSNLSIMFCLAVFGLQLGTRREKIRWRPGTIDFFIGLVLVSVATSFVLNPVGIRAFGTSGLVGGRPYFEVIVGLLGYIMLCSVRPDADWLNRVPVFTVIMAAVMAVGGTIAFFIPQTGIILYQFYSGFLPDVKELLGGNELDKGTGVGRSGYLSPLAVSLVYLIYAKRAPIANLSPTHTKSLLGLMIAAVLSLLSGFRGVLGAQGIYFVIASTAWQGFKGFLLTIMIAVVALSGIYFISVTVTLPDRIQRPLSFLPGEWDRRVKDTGSESTDWRVGMWEEALYGSGIGNKILGDGFGVRSAEVEYFREKQAMRRISTQEQQQYYILTGNLHSGPLTAIRYVGVIGFILYTLLILYIASGFFRLWRSCINRREAVLVGFFALPATYLPLKYLFVFGAFNIDFPQSLITAGMLVLCRNVISEMREQASGEEEVLSTSPGN